MVRARSRKIDALDGFRGIAAIFVCIYHTSQWWVFSVPRAPLAVDLFFLLSGFVIGHSYDQRLRAGQLSARAFCAVRLIRLYPMYLISLLLVSSMFLVGVLAQHRHGSEHLAVEYVSATLAGLFVLPMKFSGDTVFFPLNIVYWSLFFELACNFAYAALYSRLTNRVLLATVAACAPVLIVVVYLNGDIDLGPVWTWLSFIGGLTRAVFGISAGLLMYRLQGRITAGEVGPIHSIVPMFLIALLLGAPLIGQLDWLLQLLAVFIIFPACIAGVIPRPKAPRTDSSPPSRILALLGVASYPIYLLHMPIGRILDVLAGGKLGEFAPFSGIFVVLFVFVAGVLVAQNLDAPIRRYLTARIFADRSVASLIPHQH